MSRRARVAVVVRTALVALAALLPTLGCGSADTAPGSRVDAGLDGGSQATGGNAGTGGAPGTGGGMTAPGSGGSTGTGGREVSTGGVVGSAGAGAGGVRGTGGGGPGNGGQAATGGRTGQSGGTAGGQSIGNGGASAGGGSGNITIWMAGDSTMAVTGPPCPVGWGAQFKPFFDDRVTINDLAQSGTSLHTWLYNVLTTEDASGECNLTLDATGKPVVQRHWQEMLDGMKPGDYLFIEFGINDGGGSNGMRCPRYEGDATFIASYGMMAKAAKDRGAQAVFLTPTSSIACSGSVAVGTRGRFVQDAKAAGAEFGVPVLDVHQLSVDLFTASGFCPAGAAGVTAATGGPVGAFFCNDHTHFETSGAQAIAKLVAGAIRSQNLPLSAYLN